MTPRTRKKCPGCGRQCRGVTCRTCMPTRYTGEVERVMARRATARASQKRQYALYTSLCLTFSIPVRPDWTKHMGELRASSPRHIALLEKLQDVPTKQMVFFRWWLRRFSLDEIHAMSAGIGQLSPPDNSSFVHPTRARLAA